MSHLLRLPVEVLEGILEFLPSIPGNSLLACALSCKQLCQVAVPLLWKTVHVPEGGRGTTVAVEKNSVRPMLLRLAAVLEGKSPPDGMHSRGQRKEPLCSLKRTYSQRQSLSASDSSSSSADYPQKLKRKFSLSVLEERLHQDARRASHVNVIGNNNKDGVASTLFDYAKWVRHLSIGLAHGELLQLFELPSHLLSRILQRVDRLQSLTLTECEVLDDQHLKTVALVCGRTLKHVSLTGAHLVTDYGLTLLAKNLVVWHSLELVLCSRVGDEGVQAVAKNAHKLNALTLHGCHGIGNPGVQAVCQHLHASLTTLRLSSLRPLCSDTHRQLCAFTHLQVLSLSGHWSLTDEDLIAIGRSCLGTLHTLHLDGCTRITNNALCTLSAFHPRLHTLNLASNANITDVGFLALVRACGPCLEHLFFGRCSQLTNRALVELGKSCPRLKAVYTAGCERFTDSGFQAMLSGIRALEVLSIPGCPFTDATILTACTLHSKTLRVAQFSFNAKVSPFAIGELVLVCPQLHVLQLVQCTRILASFLTRFSRACPDRLADRYQGVYCAMRSAEIVQLRRFYLCKIQEGHAKEEMSQWKAWDVSI